MIVLSQNKGTAWLTADDAKGEYTVCFGLSTETKPKPFTNSMFFEIDTGKSFVANGAVWTEVLNAAYVLK